MAYCLAKQLAISISFPGRGCALAEVTREDLALLLTEARRLTSHRQYVIIGSLSILGSVTRPPARMVASQDVDLYPLLDPGRASEIAAHLGQSTPFDRDHGFYADAVSPYLATLPDGWQSRLVSISWPEGIVALCLEPHDAADPNMRVVKTGIENGSGRGWTREYSISE